MVGAIDKVTNLSKEWNREKFGNIFRKKRLLQARIKGIQEAEAYHFSQRLQNMELKLKKELDNILNEEEILWFQKSRRAWI